MLRQVGHFSFWSGSMLMEGVDGLPVPCYFSGEYSVFRKHMHKTPQIATNSKIASSMATRRKKQKHRCLQRFCAMIFAKNVLFGQFLASEASQNKEGRVPPHPPSTA